MSFSRGHADRGQTGPVGLTLVFGFVLVGAILIVVVGATMLGDAQDSFDEDRAEKALTQFDSKAALGNTDTQTVSFAKASGSDFEVKNGTGWMRITIDNQSDNQGPKELLNQSMGSVVYETGDTKLAYQGGGIWRSDTKNSVMVSPPEFHFRNGTLTLPVVTGDRSLGDEATITHKQTTKQFPNVTQDANFTNPLTLHKVKVSVQSDYYRGWGSYFEERTIGKVDYDHERKIANLSLVTPLEKDSVSSASASLAASGDFIISGSSASMCGTNNYTNSYDSDVGDYCSQTPGDDGDIVYGGNVDIDSGSGSSYIKGDVVSGGTVSVKGNTGGGQPWVYGNINYTVDCVTNGGHSDDCAIRIEDSSGGTVNNIDDVESAPRINAVVNGTVYKLKDSANNDNDTTGNISSNELQYTSGEVTLHAGDYYVDHIRPSSGNSIVFNTTEENVTLAVRGDVDMENYSNIEVVGDNNVKLYVNGESSYSDGDGWTFDMESNSTAETPGDVASQFRVYGKDDFSFRMAAGEGHKFVGVIYAPPGASGSGEVFIDEGHIFGGILTGTTEIDTNGAIHYDEALEGKKIISRSANIVKVTYLHVSINEVEVTG